MSKLPLSTQTFGLKYDYSATNVINQEVIYRLLPSARLATLPFLLV